jgi:hypothetical protein
VRKILRLLGFVFAFSAGVLPALSIIMAVFADMSNFAERLFTFALVIIAYGSLGLLFGYILPGVSWRCGIWVTIPVIIITDWYSIHEPWHLAMHFLYFITAFAAACQGAANGASLAQKRQKNEIYSRDKR